MLGPTLRSAQEPRTEAQPPCAGPFSIGQLIADTYEITRILGHGGMGIVYEARDTALLRRVAIKAALSASSVQALRIEAQALAAIRSPAFVSVLHLGRHRGVDFMVMERLYGDTLESRIDEARARNRELALQDVLDLLIAIADALSTAHGLGIALRDLKPANILVCGERVVLIDMGLFVPEVLVDPENEAAGSVEYIAPEVLLRTVQKGRGPLIDLYALGVIAYELLTNKTPFAAASPGSVLANHVGAPVPDVTELRPEVPRALSALVTELLSKDPAARPSSAEAVLWQLRDIRASGLRQSKSMQVLAVDDEAHVGLSLKRSLESEFPQVHVEPTTNPLDAIDQSRHTAPDVVLVDLNMPKHNGIEVCMSILALPANLRPIVVGMSAQATSADVAVLRSLGVRHFVPKDADFVTAMSNVIRDLRSGGPPSSQR